MRFARFQGRVLSSRSSYLLAFACALGSLNACAIEPSASEPRVRTKGSSEQAAFLEAQSQTLLQNVRTRFGIALQGSERNEALWNLVDADEASERIRILDALARDVRNNPMLFLLPSTVAQEGGNCGEAVLLQSVNLFSTRVLDVRGCTGLQMFIRSLREDGARGLPAAATTQLAAWLFGFERSFPSSFMESVPLSTLLDEGNELDEGRVALLQYNLNFPQETRTHRLVALKSQNNFWVLNNQLWEPKVETIEDWHERLAAFMQEEGGELLDGRMDVYSMTIPFSSSGPP